MRVSYLGGDSEHRGLFGNSLPKTRIAALAVAAVLGLGCVWAWSLWGLLPGLLLPLVAWVITIQTDNATPLQRFLKRRFWRSKEKDGTTTFIPFDGDGYEMLTERWFAAKGRRAKREAAKQLHAMRDVPDGVEGMVWLQDEDAHPGIQWHSVPYGEEYLAVVFSTTGQVEGIEGDEVFDAASSGFEGLAAKLGESLSLANRIQPLTRVLPTDSTWHEFWLVNNADRNVPAIVHRSYTEVVANVAAGQLTQRRFFVVCWPVAGRFTERAKRLGVDADGWRLLMETEIAKMHRAFTAAGFKNVSALSARETAAVIRHLQHPGYPLEQVADLGPSTGWLPSHDSWSYTSYTGSPGGEISDYLSRTARISAKNIELAERHVLWMAPMLGEMDEQVVRTISWHILMSPQDAARFKAEKDRVSDLSNKSRRAKQGILEDSALNIEERAAKRRIEDLEPGSGHSGANWVGYVTVSAPSRLELADACDRIAEAASQAGISRLDWLDPYQSIANAYTWPVGRGIRPEASTLTERVEKLAAGKEAQEAL